MNVRTNRVHNILNLPLSKFSICLFYILYHYITNISVILSSLVTTPTEPIITSNHDVSLYFSGITIIFTCRFTVDSSIFGDPNVVVTAQWTKGGNVLTGDSRLNVRAPKGFGSNIYFRSLEFEFLTQLDSDNYIVNFLLLQM